MVTQQPQPQAQRQGWGWLKKAGPEAGPQRWWVDLPHTGAASYDGSVSEGAG